MWVRSLGWEDLLEGGIATHSSVLAWRIPMEKGAWWDTAHRVAKSWTRLKWISMHTLAAHHNQRDAGLRLPLATSAWGSSLPILPFVSVTNACTHIHLTIQVSPAGAICTANAGVLHGHLDETHCEVLSAMIPLGFLSLGVGTLHCI